jgi:hypothetical protein
MVSKFSIHGFVVVESLNGIGFSFAMRVFLISYCSL